MEKVIDKELISHLLKLKSDQQGKVLTYIKNLLVDDEMNRRTEDSERAIDSGEIKSFEQFDSDFENWKAKKRDNIK